MNKQQAFQEVFVSAFNDGKLWRDWFFRNVVVNDDEISISLDGMGRPSGALLMQPYDFRYFGGNLRSDYMSCVATKPEARAKGVASGLITDALTAALEKGTVLCSLIPAREHLYYFYKRFGFATVYYVNRMRYTALHSFAGAGVPAEPDFGLFSALENRVGCGITHSRRQYELVLGDIAVDGGYAFAAREGDGAAIVLAAPDGPLVKVKCMLADSEALADGVLAQLRDAVGEKEIVVDTPPLTGDKAFLRPYGMVRIVDAGALLGALAAAHRHLSCAIRLHDAVISANNGIFSIRDGVCTHPEAYGGRVDIDVDIEVLASILFSSSKVASVFGIPGRRPYMTLMLD